MTEFARLHQALLDMSIPKIAEDALCCDDASMLSAGDPPAEAMPDPFNCAIVRNLSTSVFIASSSLKTLS